MLTINRMTSVGSTVSESLSAYRLIVGARHHVLVGGLTRQRRSLNFKFSNTEIPGRVDEKTKSEKTVVSNADNSNAINGAKPSYSIAGDLGGRTPSSKSTTSGSGDGDSKVGSKSPNGGGSTGDDKSSSSTDKGTGKDEDEKPSWAVQMFGDVRKDNGLLIMNMGAILSLTGFMMHDVLHLRCMSICGSLCGAAYNYTRKPPQFAPIAWGCVFLSVNIAQVIRLLLERREPNFSAKEVRLYTEHFKKWGVTMIQFRKLLKAVKWLEFKTGETIVKAGEPLTSVVLVHEGKASTYDRTQNRGNRECEILYTYDGSRLGGNLIGGAALLDETVSHNNCPNEVVARTDCSCVAWNIVCLRSLMESDHDLENAILHALYVELVQSLRHGHNEQDPHVACGEADKAAASRSATPSAASPADSGTFQRTAAPPSRSLPASNRSTSILGPHSPRWVNHLDGLEDLIKACVHNAKRTEGTGGEKKDQILVLDVMKKREVRNYIDKHNINTHLKENILGRYGWTLEEWEDGYQLVG